MSRDRKRREEAKRLEKEGRVEEAVKAYLASGSFSDAVRTYANARQPLDAAQLIMKVLKVAPDEVGDLTGEKRRLARQAGRFFADADRVIESAAIKAALTTDDEAEEKSAPAPDPANRPVQRLVDRTAQASVPPKGSRPPKSSVSPRPSPPPAPSVTPPPESRGSRRRDSSNHGRQSNPGRGRESLAHAPDSSPGPQSAGPRRVRRTISRVSTGGQKRPSDPPRASKPSLGRAGARDLAVRLEARGDYELARTAFLRLGAHGDAARVAEKAKQPLEAAKLYREAKRYDDAARCYIEAGDDDKAFDALLAIEPDHASYRKACAQAIDLASKKGHLDLELHGFVRRFVLAGVGAAAELEAFYELGRLYERTDHESSALEVYGQIEAHEPLYRDVADRVAALESGSRVATTENAVGDGSRYSSVSADRASHDRIPNVAKRQASGTVPRSEPPPDESEPPEANEGENQLAVGAIIANRYRVKVLLGTGGMAEVYEVLDQELGEIIALKLFTTEVNSPALLARCRRELVLARELNHDNIVRVFDIGLHGERRFITMEMLEGSDLRDMMDDELPTWGRSLRYLVQACNGLHAAHLRGVVHRDVKPENFFVTKSDHLKVMDFGIAKRATDTDEIILDGTTAGTPVYMSPEQIRDYSNVTPIADVYSIGVMAFELLTGEVPFYTEDARELMMMHLKEPPPPPTLLEPELPQDLEDIVLHALEKDANKRLKTCREMAEQLQRVIDALEG